MSNRVTNALDHWMNTPAESRLACPLTRDELEYMAESEATDAALDSACEAVGIAVGSPWSMVAKAILADWAEWAPYANAVDMEG